MWCIDENIRWNHERPLFFVHNQRCAGTNFNLLLAEHYYRNFFKSGYKLVGMELRNPADNAEHDQARVSTDKLRVNLTKLVGQRSSFVAAGHFGVDFVDSFPGEKFVITNFRHPFNRFVSCCHAFGKGVFGNPYYLHMFVTNFTGKTFSMRSPPGRADVDLAIGRMRQLDGLLDQARFTLSLGEIERKLHLEPLVSLFAAIPQRELAGNTDRFVRLSEDDRRKLLVVLRHDIEVYDEMTLTLDKRLKLHPRDEEWIQTRDALGSIFNTAAWKKHCGISRLAHIRRLSVDQVTDGVCGMVREQLIQRPHFRALMDEMRGEIAKLTFYMSAFRRAVDMGVEKGARIP